MLKRIRFWGGILAGLCSLIFIYIKYGHQPFPLKIWGLDQSPAAKWILLFVFCCAGMVFAMFLWLWIFDWIAGGSSKSNVLVRIKQSWLLTIECRGLNVKLRCLRFLTDIIVMGGSGFLVAISLIEFLPKKFANLLSDISLCLILAALVALAPSLILWVDIKKNIQKDIYFYNCEKVRKIINGVYKESNLIFKLAMEKLFPA